MSLLIPREHGPGHLPEPDDFHPTPLNDFYSRMLIQIAFPSEEELTPTRRRSKLRGRSISRTVAQSIGLEELPPVQDDSLLSIRGRLSELFADDNRSSADIVRELRETNE